MFGWHHWLNGLEFEQTLGVGNGQEGLACCSPWGHKESDTTELLTHTHRTLLKVKKKKNLISKFNALFTSLIWPFSNTWPSSVKFSLSVVSNSLQPHGLQHIRPPCPSPTPGVYSNSCPLSQWCHPTISSSVVPFSSCLQSFPASGSFPTSQFFASGGESIGVSASASVFPMTAQDWFPLGLTGLISLQSNGLSRVFSNTTVQKHQAFFMVQLSHLYMTTWKTIAWTIRTFVAKWLCFLILCLGLS